MLSKNSAPSCIPSGVLCSDCRICVKVFHWVHLWGILWSMHIETHAFPFASSSWMAAPNIASASPVFPVTLGDPMKTDGRGAGCSSDYLRLLAVTASHSSHLNIFVFSAQTLLPLLGTSLPSCALHMLVLTRRFSLCLLAWAVLFTFDDGCFF